MWRAGEVLSREDVDGADGDVTVVLSVEPVGGDESVELRLSVLPVSSLYTCAKVRNTTALQQGAYEDVYF